MKNIYSFILALMLTSGLYAQNKTYNLTVCFKLDTVQLAPTQVSLICYHNGIKDSSSYLVPSGVSQSCFKPISLVSDSGNYAHYSVQLIANNCYPLTTTVGVINSNTTLNLQPITSCPPPVYSLNITAIPHAFSSGYTLYATTGFPSPVSYTWNTGQTSSFIQEYSKGNYCVTATWANGYTLTSCFTDSTSGVGKNCAITLTNKLLPDSSVLLVASGTGAGSITYSWSKYGLPFGNSDSLKVTKSGVYCVTMKDSLGCSATACDSVGFSSQINCSVMLAPVYTKGNPKPYLKAQSTGTSPFSYTWTFNGAPSAWTMDTITPGYNSLVCCIVSDSNGCSNSDCYNYYAQSFCSTYITDTIFPNMPPLATHTLIANTYNANPPYLYKWLYNGVFLDSTQSINVTKSGYYAVYVTDANGCLSVDSTYLNINNGNCSAKINWVSNPIGGITITALGNGIPPYTYVWSNGSKSQSIVSTKAGYYSVTILDSLGCVAIASMVDSISSIPCSVTIATTPTPNAGVVVLSIAQTTTTGGGLKINWYFNNQPLAVNVSTITASKKGYYCVTIIDSIGCVAQACYTHGLSSGCSTSILSLTPPNVPPNTIVTLQTKNSGTAPFTYAWYYNKGVYIDTASSITVTNSGKYFVKVSDATGCVSVDTININLKAGSGQCQTILLDSAVSNAHILYAYSTGVGPYTYWWSINNIPILNNNSNTFYATQGGLYRVTIIDSLGCTSADTVSISITSCSANTSVGIDSSGNVMITAGSTGVAPFTYSWTLNGYPISNQISITPTINGNYCYKVADANGCVASDCYFDSSKVSTNGCSVYFTSAVSIIANPTPNFVNIQFHSFPNGTPPFKYLWKFSDGATSNQDNPVHKFYSSNVADLVWSWATLTITDSTGCVSNYSNSVIITPTAANCVAYFNLNSSYSKNAIGEVQLKNLSKNIGTGATFNWNFGDSTTSTLENPTHTYKSTGMYYVCLTVTTANGCVSSFCQTNYIDLSWWNGLPASSSCKAGFKLMPNVNAAGLAYIVDVSQVNNAFYTWTVSNGFSSNSQTPYFNLNGVGNYIVCLTVTDTVSACTDTYCDTLTVDSLGNVYKVDSNSKMFMSKTGNVGISVIASPKFSIATDIESVDVRSDLTIRPNPANDFVTVTLNNLENAAIIIYDITGNVVKNLSVQQPKENNNVTINVADISNGTYFLKVSTSNKIKTSKLIVNH